MVRSMNKIARRLALKQLAGKDIRSKITSEAKHEGWPEGKLKRLILTHYQMEEGKRWKK